MDQGLGTAPARYAKANRFSETGVEMFYGAEDLDTCAAEIRLDPPTGGVLGRFSPKAGLRYLDLTALPTIPSVYDRELGSLRRDIMFLHTFAHECSKPADTSVASPGSRYVATQIVSKFLLSPDSWDGLIDAIRFTSSLTGQPCWVINLPHSACIDGFPKDPSKAVMRLIEKQNF